MSAFTGIEGIVAIKDMDIQDERSVQDWKKEIATMNQNRCPYVVNIFGFSSDQSNLTIVMEYMAKGKNQNKERRSSCVLLRENCRRKTLILFSR